MIHFVLDGFERKIEVLKMYDVYGKRTSLASEAAACVVRLANGHLDTFNVEVPGSVWTLQ